MLILLITNTHTLLHYFNMWNLLHHCTPACLCQPQIEKQSNCTKQTSQNMWLSVRQDILAEWTCCYAFANIKSMLSLYLLKLGFSFEFSWSMHHYGLLNTTVGNLMRPLNLISLIMCVSKGKSTRMSLMLTAVRR